MTLNNYDLGNIISLKVNGYKNEWYDHFGNLESFSYSNDNLNFVKIKKKTMKLTVYEGYFKNILVYDIKSYFNWKLTSKYKIYEDVDKIIESFLVGNEISNVKIQYLNCFI